MLFLSMQQVRKLHLTTEIQSMSKVFVIPEHVSMKNAKNMPRSLDDRWPFDNRMSAFFILLNWVSGYGYYSN